MDGWLDLASDRQGYFFACFGAALVVIVWARFLGAKRKAKSTMHNRNVKQLSDAGLMTCVVFTCFMVLFWLHVLGVLRSPETQ